MKMREKMNMTQSLIGYKVLWEGVAEGEEYEGNPLVVDAQLLCL